MPDRIYLDHAATTPMRPEAIAAVEEGMRRWANPSSPHAEGRAARAALEDARVRIKAALGWDGELIFTSGASEALVIGLGRVKAERKLVSAVEHDAVFRAAPGAEVIPVAAKGLLDRDVLADALERAPRSILALQYVNSEIGLMQSIGEIAGQMHESGGMLLCDCAQAAGKFPIPPEVDMAVVSAHKLGGPPGIGALLVRDLGVLEPIGGHEFGYRMGTENLPAILGFAAALDGSQLVRGCATWDTAFHGALERLECTIVEAGGELVTADGDISVFLGAYAMPGLGAAAQLIQFDMAGFAVSAGSACSSGTLKASRALAAFGIADEVAARTIRVSIGWTNAPDDLDRFGEAWLRTAQRARERAA